jgi:hypothetical protein
MRYCPQFPGGIPHQEVDYPRVTHPYATLLRIAPFLVRLACVKRAASVDSEPGSNSRLNRLFLTGQPYGRPSLQFELKLLTKFLLRIQPDCQTSAHFIRDLLERRIPCRPRKPFGCVKPPLDQDSARNGSV